eukprot:998193-Pelagomonas_calceolata.AAC.1
MPPQLAMPPPPPKRKPSKKKQQEQQHASFLAWQQQQQQPLFMPGTGWQWTHPQTSLPPARMGAQHMLSMHSNETAKGGGLWPL